MRWVLASSREKISLAGNGASSSPEGSMSGRGTVSVSDFLVLGLLLEVLLSLAVTTGSFDSD